MKESRNKDTWAAIFEGGSRAMLCGKMLMCAQRQRAEVASIIQTHKKKCSPKVTK